MQEVNLFGIFVHILNKNQMQYFVTGSVAAIVYPLQYSGSRDEDRFCDTQSVFLPRRHGEKKG